MQKIFVVEDDVNIRELLEYTLKTNNFEVSVFENGESVLLALEKNKPDLVILDIMLQTKISGIEILKTVREKYREYDIKVIMLTAKNSEMNIVNGLNLGANDYITKPFSVLELVARVKASLREVNSSNKEKSFFNFGSIKIITNKNIVFEDKNEIYLTDKEYAILKLLINNANKVVDRETIFDCVWNGELVESRTIDMHINNLRKKIKFCESNIITVRSMGYKIIEE